MSIIGNKEKKHEDGREINKEKVKKRSRKIISKIQNIVSDMHNQCGNLMTKMFKNIFIPPFEVSKMVKKEKRNIPKMVVKSLLTLSHYAYRKKLVGMCKVRGNKMIIVNESYTTQTCGKCGEINKIGASKIYKCKECGLEVDRDIHSARDICIRTIT